MKGRGLGEENGGRRTLVAPGPLTLLGEIHGSAVGREACREGK